MAIFSPVFFMVITVFVVTTRGRAPTFPGALESAAFDLGMGVYVLWMIS